MKKNMRYAYNALKKIGAPVIDHGEENFMISAENNVKTLWADYYAMGDGYTCGDQLDDFGVNKKINAILDKYGLFAEWQNPGCLNVHEA
jgi:hypothetical protein